MAYDGASLSGKWEKEVYKYFRDKFDGGKIGLPIDVWNELKKRFKDVEKQYSDYTSILTRLKRKVKNIGKGKDQKENRNIANLEVSMNKFYTLYDFFNCECSKNTDKSKKAKKMNDQVDKIKKELEKDKKDKKGYTKNNKIADDYVTRANKIFQGRGMSCYGDLLDIFFKAENEILDVAFKIFETTLRERRKVVDEYNTTRDEADKTIIVAVKLIAADAKGSLRWLLSSVQEKCDGILDELTTAKLWDNYQVFEKKRQKLITSIKTEMKVGQEVLNTLDGIEKLVRYGEFTGKADDKAVFGFFDSKQACKHFIANFSKFVTSIAAGASLKTLEQSFKELKKTQVLILDAVGEYSGKDKSFTSKDNIIRSEAKEFINDFKELKEKCINETSELKACDTALDGYKLELDEILAEHKKYHSFTGRFKRGKAHIDGVLGGIEKTIGTIGNIFRAVKNVVDTKWTLEKYQIWLQEQEQLAKQQGGGNL